MQSEPSISIRAEHGGIAAGRDVHIGIPAEHLTALVRQSADLSETQKKLITKLEDELELNQRQIRTALNILDEADVQPEALAAKLVEIAGRFKALYATASAQLGDTSRIAALKTEAQQAVDAGDLDKADSALADVEVEQRRALDRVAWNTAETTAKRGDIAMTRLRYSEAATHFASATTILAGDAAAPMRLRYLSREAQALYLLGEEFGDNDALRKAIDLYKRLLEFRPRAHMPLEWATTQYNLGTALEVLGEREGGTDGLEEAVAAHRAALTEWTRERAPLEWAKTQNNVGLALVRLGDREGGTDRLEEAVAAHRATLTEWTRERAPFEWAMAQHNLGKALNALGEREKRTERVEDAVAAYRAALTEWTREREPLSWAKTQHNLGVIFMRQGEGASGTQRLEDALAAFHAALTVMTRERVPLMWATVQNGLGNVLKMLGARDSGIGRLLEAVTAFSAALTEWTRERVPLDWAAATGNQGAALMVLAERTQDHKMATLAIDQIRSACDVMRAAGHTAHADHYQTWHADALTVASMIEQRADQVDSDGRAGKPSEAGSDFR